jgi:hypothetical protein
MLRPEDIEAWANAINTGHATMEEPSHILWEHLLNRSDRIARGEAGGDGGSSNKSKVSATDKLTELLTKQVEMGVLQGIMASQARLAEQQAVQSSIIHPRPGSRPGSRHGYGAVQQAGITMPLVSRSSPISDNEDDANIIQGFFEWKISCINDENAANVWRKAYGVVVENQWAIDDLKAMSDTQGRAYVEATEAGIATGVARNFRKHLASYKLFIKGAGVQ